jgi:transposase InsO family protein
LSNGISTVDSSTPILVSDTGNDQTLLTSIWRIVARTGREVMMTGAFAGRNVGESFPVVSAVAKLVGADGIAYAATVHEALYDSNPLQVESLLSVHQALRDTNNGIDDRAMCERDIDGNPGKQAARFGDIVIPFHFDGTKCFFEVLPITDFELRTLRNVTLTDGRVPYEPILRLHSRRTGPTSDATNDLIRWKRHLGFVPNHVIRKTLQATTQMVPTVEAETREIMRDHLQTRLPQLKVRRVNDRCYVDTFFSSVPSVRGFTCWNLFAFKQTGLDAVYLMRRRSQSPTTLTSLITEYGAPVEIYSDNAPEFCGKKWRDILSTYMIGALYTEPHHPNENLAERRGGALKAATVHLLTVTGAPLNYWCFALEYMSLVRSILARRSLDWKSPHECHWGDRPDISVFRFAFWEPIWYYCPRQSFPHPKMLRGRFLGIAQNVGDAFCFLILTVPDPDSNEVPQVLSRSVIRSRYYDDRTINSTGAEATGPTVTGNTDTVIFYRSDGRTALPDPPP